MSSSVLAYTDPNPLPNVGVVGRLGSGVAERDGKGVTDREDEAGDRGGGNRKPGVVSAKAYALRLGTSYSLVLES